MADITESIRRIIEPLQLACLATITTDGLPWVRYVMTAGDAEMTLRCATHVDARKVAQIAENPEVHVTLGCPDPMEMKPYVQVQGRARLATDSDQRHGFWFAMLSGIFDGPDDPAYGVIVIEPYRIELCSAETVESAVWEKA